MSLLTLFSNNPELQIASIVVGDVDDSTVVVTFTWPVIAADYAAGVTIEVDDVGATISSATRQSDHKVVYFVLSAPVTNANVVDVLYDASAGSYSKEDALIDFGINAVTSHVGAALWFDNANNSGELLLIGI